MVLSEDEIQDLDSISERLADHGYGNDADTLTELFEGCIEGLQSPPWPHGNRFSPTPAQLVHYDKTRKIRS